MKYEPPRLTPLGQCAAPLVGGASEFFRCTALEARGAPRCPSESPHTKDVGALRELARGAGWRLSGPDETELFPGEALCPKHREFSIVDVLVKHAVAYGQK